MKEFILKNEEQEQLFSEGLGVFETTSVDGEEYNCFQKLDESDVFKDDFEAWSFVVKQHLKNSDLHTKVFNFYKDENPKDFKLLMKNSVLGYQIEDEHKNNFEHESFEVVENIDKAKEILDRAKDSSDVNWQLITIHCDTIENPSFY